MGMFDSFFAPVTCPDCGTHHPVAELQTKAGRCDLLRFNIGDDTLKGGFGIRTGTLETTLYCRAEACEVRMKQAIQARKESDPWPEYPRVKIFIDNFIFVGIRVRRPDEYGEDAEYDDERTVKPETVPTRSSDAYLEQLEQVIARIKDYFENGDYSKVYDELKDYGHLSMKE